MPAKSKQVAAPVVTTKGKTGKVVAPPATKPKRAPSPYIIFCTEKRAEVKAANPDATFGGLGKLLGELWAQLGDAGKAPYVQKSATKKAELEG